MSSTLQALLHIAAAILMTVQHNPEIPAALQQKLVAEASQSIQLVTQAAAKVNYPQMPSTTIWPNYERLRASLYLDSYGKRVPLGQGIALLSEYISFGDLNGDGLDDAAVIVQKLNTNGETSRAVAVLLNQGGILFNIADVPLGNDLTIYDHRIQSGEFMIDMQAGSSSRKIFHFDLWGNELVPR